MDVAIGQAILVVPQRLKSVAEKALDVPEAELREIPTLPEGTPLVKVAQRGEAQGWASAFDVFVPQEEMRSGTPSMYLRERPGMGDERYFELPDSFTA